MITPDQVIAVARSWVGVRFLHQGRTRNGIDCIGLALAVGEELELLPAGVDQRNYARHPSSSLLVEEISKVCTPAGVAEPASLLVIAWGRDPYHVAICTGPTMIHASYSARKVVENGFRHPWPKLTRSAWRLPGVAYV